MAVDVHPPAEHRRVFRKVLLPAEVAEDDHGVAAEHLVLVGPERSAEHGFDAHRREQVGAHQ